MSSASERGIRVVVKVGGSLFDLPDFGPRLCHWLETSSLGNVLLVPGGGGDADVVRGWDRAGGLDEDGAHWLALRVLSLHAYVLRALVPCAVVVRGPRVCAEDWSRGSISILDPLTFAAADELRPGHLPHSWEVTSDSVAARAAIIAEARRLILLKSATFPEPIDWSKASRAGFVDAYFPRVIGGTTLQVEAVNLRAWQT
jgi:aspartokinase-like uncharacterized kinase